MASSVSSEGIKGTAAREVGNLARKRDRNLERVVTAVAFVFLILAWFYGYNSNGSDLLPLVRGVLPGAERVEERGGIYFAYAGMTNSGRPVGYAGLGEAMGYAGPIEVLVGVSPSGQIVGVQIIDHRETPGFFRRLPENSFFEQFLGKTYTDSLRLGQGIDAVSGATVSSEAVARAIRDEVGSLARDPIGAHVEQTAEPVVFGIPEIILISLFIAGYFGHRSRKQTAKKWVRRVTLIIGAIGLGFVYNKPLTIANFISLISGYWPDWHNNLYWFLLLGGILFVTTAQGRNPYCSWFCPFGAVQEGLGRISGAKLYRPRRWHNLLKWIQRGLAYTAVVLGLALRQPGPVSYEPFGTLFDFNGSQPQWILLAMILVGSMLVYRPFCSYLCPLEPVVAYIGEGRRWIQDVVRRKRR